MVEAAVMLTHEVMNVESPDVAEQRGQKDKQAEVCACE